MVAIAVVLASCLLSLTSVVLAGQPTTVILVRHAERPPGANPSLSPVGLKRAARLGEVLQNVELNAVFATQYCRTAQTAQPTALKASVPIQIFPTAEGEVDFSTCDPPIERIGKVHRFQANHARDLAQIILSDYSGQTVLIVGHSDTIPALIAELGGPVLCPEPFPLVDGECHIFSGEHDNLFILTITENGTSFLRLRY
ncbi:MAG TPA: histidine phosphatase family protein [Acidobacteriota bacterium]|nr:histidine phosphatase family protein [Acidobacteriota bacterium]